MVYPVNLTEESLEELRVEIRRLVGQIAPKYWTGWAYHAVSTEWKERIEKMIEDEFRKQMGPTLEKMINEELERMAKLRERLPPEESDILKRMKELEEEIKRIAFTLKETITKEEAEELEKKRIPLLEEYETLRKKLNEEKKKTKSNPGKKSYRIKDRFGKIQTEDIGKKKGYFRRRADGEPL